MPQRRCVGCGRRAGKSEFVRVAIAGPGARKSRTIVLDRDRKLSGRGAYLCADPPGVPAQSCLERAIDRRSISRALRCAANIDCSDLLESVG